MDDNNEPLTFNKEISGRTLIISPANQWPYGTKCTVLIPVSAVNDLANNSLATESIYVFTTLDFLVNNQGPGYQAGAYEQGAVQPGTFNWSRQSRFNCSDSANQVWLYLVDGSIYSSPAIGADGTIYVGSDDNNLYAIAPDGTMKWSFATGSYIESSPAIGLYGCIYVGSCDKKLYAINPDGSKKWSFLTGDYICSSPAIGADGTIYVGSYDKKLYAINTDGSQKWAFVRFSRQVKNGTDQGCAEVIHFHIRAMGKSIFFRRFSDALFIADNHNFHLFTQRLPGTQRVMLDQAGKWINKGLWSREKGQ